MLDVHAPHKPIENVKEFLFHIFTITVGLLIALSLEGLVEWQHHRHLVHDAEASLHGEIDRNAAAIKDTTAELHKEQANLKHDIAVLNQLIQTGKMPQHEQMTVGFHIRSFENLGWKTAQATGASSYMTYTIAQQYADIYTTQDELADAEKQAARDAIISLAPFIGAADNAPDPSAAEAIAIKEKISILQGQLLLVDSLMASLDSSYKKFLAAHKES